MSGEKAAFFALSVLPFIYEKWYHFVVIYSIPRKNLIFNDYFKKFFSYKNF